MSPWRRPAPLAACVALAAAAAVAAPEDDIRAVLAAQEAAWNRGDLAAFMDGYVRSDALRFASGDSVTFGWQAALDRYRRRYPDGAAMGTLHFHGLVVTPLADDAAIVFGHWELARAQDHPHGLFTLTLKKTADGWRILQDHTSAAP